MREPFISINYISIQLTHIYLILSTCYNITKCFPSIVYFLQEFSSSVNVLSLNFSCLNIRKQKFFLYSSISMILNKIIHKYELIILEYLSSIE